MSELTNFIASGILELYAMGLADKEEMVAVEKMALLHEEVREELAALNLSLEKYSEQFRQEPDPLIKPFLMATIDYMDRLEKGEQPAYPPDLGPDSKISDYEEWLNREDLKPAGPVHQIDARIIGYTPQSTIAIIYLEHGAPPETHTHEHERFLIVEGTCNIVVDGQDNHLQPGDVFTIPLHLSHTVIVTSALPCRIILQRAAA